MTNKTADELIAVAQIICERMLPETTRKLPHEILVLEHYAVAIVVDVNDVDYILTLARCPKQRQRPQEN